MDPDMASLLMSSASTARHLCSSSCSRAHRPAESNTREKESVPWGSAHKTFGHAAFTMLRQVHICACCLPRHADALPHVARHIDEYGTELLAAQHSSEG